MISASFGFKDLIQKLELKEEFTPLEKKSTLILLKEEKEEDIKRLKTIQLELHEDFIKIVEKSRGSKLKDPEKTIFLPGSFGQAKHRLLLG